MCGQVLIIMGEKIEIINIGTLKLVVESEGRIMKGFILSCQQMVVQGQNKSSFN